MRWFYLCMAVIRKFDCMARSYPWRPRLHTWLCAYVHTYIHIGERPAAWLGATIRRPAYMYWWTRSQNALTVTYEKIVRAMVERCESGQKWAHFFFLCWLSSGLTFALPWGWSSAIAWAALLNQYQLGCCCCCYMVLCAMALLSLSLSSSSACVRAQVRGPVFITRPLNNRHHRERKKKRERDVVLSNKSIEQWA